MKNDQQVIFNLIKGMTGQANILTIPKIFIDLTGDIKAALFLSQCVYWNDRAVKWGGWFYKTAGEWQKELGLTRHELDKCRDITARYVESRILKANGSPTVHYRVRVEDLTNALIDLCSVEDPEPSNGSVLPETGKSNSTKETNPFDEKSKMELPVIVNSLTETTTETTKETKSLTAEDYKARIRNALVTGVNNHLRDLTKQTADSYPEDLKETVEIVANTFNLTIPENSGSKAFWIKGARELLEACRPNGVKAVLEVVKWDLQNKRGGSDLTISSPKSLVNLARARANTFSVDPGAPGVVEYDPNEPGITPVNQIDF